MSRPLTILVTICLLWTRCGAAPTSTIVSSQIESVGLFKNGLALVRRSVEIPGPGIYELKQLPDPVHGTFWTESDANVVTRSRIREQNVPVSGSPAGPLHQDLAGQNVTVFLTKNSGDAPPLTGTVISADRNSPGWSRQFEPQRRGDWNQGAVPPPVQNSFLLLETESGRIYLRQEQIAYVKVDSPAKTVKRSRPILQFEVVSTTKNPTRIEISYLTKGISWAPSYLVDLSNPTQLTLTQKAVLRNELETFHHARIQLISGFPNMPFSHVTSPLSPRTNWAQFFNQLNTQLQPGHLSMGNSIRQQALTFTMPSPGAGIDFSARPQGEGSDLNAQDIGFQSMEAGDALALHVATQKTRYQRIVEWIIPDTRDPRGRYSSEHERNQNSEKYQDSPWDALRFRNPFPFPMTTGPAMITANGIFNGQCSSFWVDPGEQTSLRITKSLSVRTRHREIEHEKREREIVYIGGKDYRKVTVSGHLVMNNHRNESVSMLIRRRFSGNLISADQQPETRLQESGVYSVNPRNELVWQVTLGAGGEKTLAYSYEVLVAR